MYMQDAIDSTTKAKWDVVAALERAHISFHASTEYSVVVGRLEDALKTLEETINQMTRIQKVANGDHQESYFSGRDTEADWKA